MWSYRIRSPYPSINLKRMFQNQEYNEACLSMLTSIQIDEYIKINCQSISRYVIKSFRAEVTYQNIYICFGLTILHSRNDLLTQLTLLLCGLYIIINFGSDFVNDVTKIRVKV